MSKSNNIYKDLTDNLEAMIRTGIYPPGSKIPSLRQLSQKFNLSLDTCRRGAEYLKEKGLLDFSHGSGIYVRKEETSTTINKKNIAVFITSENLCFSYCGYALTGLQAAASTKNVVIQLHFVPYHEITYKMLETVERSCDGLILLGCYDRTLDSIPVYCPCVGVSMHNSYNGTVSTVSLDPMNAAEHSLQYFEMLAVKKIKIISHSSPIYKYRGLVAYAYLQQAGMKCELVTTDDPDLNLLDSAECGYLFLSATEYNNFAEKFKQYHSVLPTDKYKILTTDGKSLLFPEYYPVSTIGTDWNQVGCLALLDCLYRIENPYAGSRRIYTDSFLHIEPISNKQ